MAIIKPFQAIRYNTKVIRIEDVVTEPCDMISSEMQDAYYARSPYNIIRIILGKEFEDPSSETDKYKRAGYYLNEWLNHNILVTEKRECFYFYRQEFDYNGLKKSRTGLIAKVKLEEFSSK